MGVQPVLGQVSSSPFQHRQAVNALDEGHARVVRERRGRSVGDLDVVVAGEPVGLEVVVGVVEDAVGVGAPVAEGVDADAAQPGGGPREELGGHAEVPVVHGDARVRLLVVQGRRDLSLLQHEDGLDDLHEAGAALEVADVGLDGAHVDGVAGAAGAAKGRRQRGRLDGVAGRGAGAVGLDVGRVGQAQPGLGVDAADQGLLGVGGREGDAWGVAVLVDGGVPDDAADHVAVFQGQVEGLQDAEASACKIHL